MAHKSQRRMCESIRKKFPDFFKNKKILDIGSLDINGSNKYLFEDCKYVGLDVIPGKNVDVVSIAHEYNAKKESFDVVMSTNQLEHDIYYEKTLKKMVYLLKPGGLMFFTVPSGGWPEHGTFKKSPNDSGTTKINNKEWGNYYKPIEESDIRRSIDVDSIFEKYKFIVSPQNIKKNKIDLLFWGIKTEVKTV